MGLVVYHQHPEPPGGRAGPDVFGGRRRAGGQGELDGKGRAAALLGREHDAPAVLAHDALADRETESGALAFGLGGEERLEHLGGEPLGHSGSVVHHVDGHPVQPAASPDHHGARASGGGDRLGRVVD
jgi:hypothetical protein